MKPTKKLHHKIGFLLLMIIFILPGCQNPQKPQDEQQAESSSKLPEIYPEMEQRVLETMYAVDGIRGIEIAIDKQQWDEIKTQYETEEETIREEKERLSNTHVDPLMYIDMESVIIPVLKEQGVKSDLIEIEKLPQDILEIWYDIQQEFYQIHRQWNVLESHLMTSNVDVEKLSKTEHKLDQATKYLAYLHIDETLLELNNVMECLSNYRDYFQTDLPSELFKMQYHLREIVLRATVDDNDAIHAHFDDMVSLMDALRPRLLEKDATDIIKKTELSIGDLRYELNEADRDLELIKLKASILMKNLDLMTVPFEASAKK